MNMSFYTALFIEHMIGALDMIFYTALFIEHVIGALDMIFYTVSFIEYMIWASRHELLYSFIYRAHFGFLYMIFYTASFIEDRIGFLDMSFYTVSFRGHEWVSGNELSTASFRGYDWVSGHELLYNLIYRTWLGFRIWASVHLSLSDSNPGVLYHSEFLDMSFSLYIFI